MSQRFIAISVIVAFIAGGSIYLFGGANSTGRGDQSGGEDAPVSFDLSPTQSVAAESSKPAVNLNIDSVPEIIAEVDGVPIKKDSYVQALKSLEQGLKRSGGSVQQAQVDSMKNNILENIVSSEALLTKAKKLGMKPDMAKVDQNLKMFRDRFPNDAAFEKTLKARSLTKAQLRANIERHFLIKALIDKEVTNKITVDKKEIKKYYDLNQAQFDRKESVHAAHILAMFDKSGGETKKDVAKKKIDAIHKKLKEGADFGELAKAESDDKGTAIQNGDLGFFERGRMVPEFEKAAFAAKVGEVTGIVETQFGYHIIKVIGKKPSGKVSLKDASKEIEAQLKRKKVEQAIDKYLDRLKKELNVKKFL